MHSQTTDSVVMCRPLHFGFNEQTGQDNEFQHKPDTALDDLQTQALTEFDRAVTILQTHGVEVLVLQHPEHLLVPDAVFPNNWFTTHNNGSVLIYPMKTPNRQLEVTPDRLSLLFKSAGYQVNNIQTITHQLHKQQILEGTGAIVFDHIKRDAYAALSERCEAEIFNDYCKLYQWHAHSFEALSSQGHPIYHTNVMMSIGSNFAIICSESIPETQREKVMASLEASQKQLIDITFEQTEKFFCANILELKNHREEPVIALSQSAWNGFNSDQKKQLSALGDCVVCDISTIEYIGGGSLRCMLAENFLPKE